MHNLSPDSLMPYTDLASAPNVTPQATPSNRTRVEFGVIH
jgi:hypothetical protein